MVVCREIMNENEKRFVSTAPYKEGKKIETHKQLFEGLRDCVVYLGIFLTW